MKPLQDHLHQMQTASPFGSRPLIGAIPPLAQTQPSVNAVFLDEPQRLTVPFYVFCAAADIYIGPDLYTSWRENLPRWRHVAQPNGAQCLVVPHAPCGVIPVASPSPQTLLQILDGEPQVIVDKTYGQITAQNAELAVGFRRGYPFWDFVPSITYGITSPFTTAAGSGTSDFVQVPPSHIFDQIMLSRTGPQASMQFGANLAITNVNTWRAMALDQTQVTATRRERLWASGVVTYGNSNFVGAAIYMILGWIDELPTFGGPSPGGTVVSVPMNLINNAVQFGPISLDVVNDLSGSAVASSFPFEIAAAIPNIPIYTTHAQELVPIFGIIRADGAVDMSLSCRVTGGVFTGRADLVGPKLQFARSAGAVQAFGRRL